MKIIKKKPQPKPNHDPLLTLYCLCLIKLIFSQQNFDFVEMNCGVAKTKQLNLKSVVNENQVLALKILFEIVRVVQINLSLMQSK